MCRKPPLRVFFRGLSKLVFWPGCLLLSLALLTFSRPASAFDPFEIQVYDGATNDPGVASLELHTNYDHAPRRRVEPPEMSWHKQAHFTFEPALGITPFWEIGAYLQFAARFDDTFYWGGVKLRSKLVTPEGWHPHLTLGLNIEIAAIPERFEADQYGGELRPIAGWDDRYFHVAVNPNIEFGLVGEGFREGPSFNPAAAAYAKIPEIIELGVEYYGSVGPIASPTRVREQEHYLFLAGNVLANPAWEINFGVGAGLTPGSNDVIVKMIFGHELGRLWGTRSPRHASNRSRTRL